MGDLNNPPTQARSDSATETMASKSSIVENKEVVAAASSNDPIPQAAGSTSGGPQSDLSKLFRLDKRTIVLTGGLGGLGLGLVQVLLEAGADVIVTDMAVKPLPDVWDGLVKVSASTSRYLQYVSCDVTCPDSVEAAMRQASQNCPHPIRGLVTCAGISGRHHAASYPHDAFKRILDVNVTGTFLCAQAVGRIMHEQNSPGSIVMIASMSGTVANRGVETVAYNSSKAAVLQMARNLAAEWGNDGTHAPIRVNTISPGYIQTPITMPTVEAIPGLKELWEGGNMLGRLSEVQEHLSGIVYLLADGSSYVTGADIRADGGHCAW